MDNDTGKIMLSFQDDFAKKIEKDGNEQEAYEGE
jgi:hypothetical protein